MAELRERLREFAPYERALHGVASLAHQVFHSTLALLELPSKLMGGMSEKKSPLPEVEKLLPAPPPAPPIPRALEEAIPEELAFWRRVWRR